MKILYISSEAVTKGSIWYYRCYLPGSYLKNLGYNVTFYEDLDKNAGFSDFDVIVFQVQSHPKVLELARKAKAKGIKIVYETDDNHFEFDNLNPHKYSESFAKDRIEVMRDFLRLADLITCTNQGLAEYLQRYNKNIAILPNSIELSTFPRKEKNDSGQIRVCITGSTSHFGDWLTIKDVYTEMLRKYANTKLVILGFPYKPLFGDLPKDRVEFHDKVKFHDYFGKLASMRIDFSLIPLQDSTFNNQGKSNVKLLELGALKIPAIASSVRPYQETIKNGENGILARKYADWMSAINLLVTDSKATKDMGEKMFEVVKEKYEINKTVKLWDQAYSQLQQ